MTARRSAPGAAAPEEAVDVLVIGSGIAGLSAALRADASARVLVVTKGELADGATRLAQGGIAGAVGPGDTPAAHAADTLAAGAGLAEPEAVRVLCEEGPERIAELIALGVAFDRTDGPGSPHALGLEGAHGRPRILHAGGDATGLAIETALVAAVRARGIPVREQAALVDLVVEDGAVRGARFLAADGRELTVRAGAVVLATGGAGQLYAHTTNPAVATGDGMAAARRAGARLADLEFCQFHPTALAAGSGAGSFLVSEAVRGEGALLRDAHGDRFMPRIDPRAELAPRDVVARAIVQVMQAQGGRPVLLDATAIGPAGIDADERARLLARRFPTIDAAVRAAGFDWAREGVPVTPAAHYMMGGILTDLDGRTTVPGLFAAGECARTGVHGANRLASNSLLEGTVFGARAADAALAEARTAAVAAGFLAAAERPQLAEATAPDHRSTARPGTAAAGTDQGASASRDWTRAQLQELMWRQVGLLRTGAELEEAARILATWAPPAPTTLAALEDRNLLHLARCVVEAALARPGSVGAHHRRDAADDPVPAHPQDAPKREAASAAAREPDPSFPRGDELVDLPPLPSPRPLQPTR
ncbi:L-aspartate oxidase [Brachybacterium phenoliresistens]|uniref:L-aspartate oxidase n=1 Tax=Brachybacterium phenoliresistens TaxID=396014 RepID=UPI0004BBA21E|nr:L-aspartate oxidase [Brachybacterium phenoliresistens]